MSYYYLPPYIEQGIAQGRLLPLPMEVILDVIADVMLATIYRIAAGASRCDTLEQVTASILRGLGIPQNEAMYFAGIPIKFVEPGADSLLVRSHQRYLGYQSAFLSDWP